MRSKIFIYLFIFTLMFTIFIYVNDKKILDSRDAQIENLESKLKRVETEKEEALRQNNELGYFSLSNNEEALTYFENRGINATELENLLVDEIVGRNRADQGNDLVPFEGMEGVMRINKVKVLNHKWILADFTDGTYWGELFISYDIDENRNLVLNTERSLLYPGN
jgi:hypothetical protein